MDSHLTLKEHHNRCMPKARSAEARLRSLNKKHGIVPDSIRAVQIACVQAVALYRSELWWDPSEAVKLTVPSVRDQPGRGRTAALLQRLSPAPPMISGPTSIYISYRALSELFQFHLNIYCNRPLSADDGG